jgi:hypothetical protein
VTVVLGAARSAVSQRLVGDFNYNSGPLTVRMQVRDLRNRWMRRQFEDLQRTEASKLWHYIALRLAGWLG